MSDDRGGSPNLAIIIGSCLIAGAVVFAGIYIGRAVKHASIAAPRDQADDESDDGQAELDAFIRLQFLDQVRRDAPAGMEFTDVSNIRFMKDDEVLAFDISYRPAAGAPVQVTKDFKLTFDGQGRYKGAFKLGETTFNVVIYVY
ncbi:MAG: hypothetical protein ACE15C_15595 [Phycisphaerae bacterium]